MSLARSVPDVLNETDLFCKCAVCQCDVRHKASYYAYGHRLCFKCFMKVCGMDEQKEEPGDTVRGIANALIICICIIAGLMLAGVLT